MQFSGHTTGQDLVTRTRFWTGVSSSTDHTINEITLSVNIWLDRVASWIMQIDKTWRFDDNNQTDEITKDTTLISGTRAYALTSATYLRVEKVMVLDSSGDYKELKFFPFDSVDSKPLREGNEDAGMPTQYSLRGRYIYLYPKPSSSNVTLASGLRIFYQRNVVYFVTTDTTAVPGFAQPFHEILALGAAYDYLKKEGSPRANDIWQMILTMKADLIEFYSSREADTQPQMKTRNEDYGEDLLSGNDSQIIVSP